MKEIEFKGKMAMVTGDRRKRVVALALMVLSVSAFALVPENQSDGERYEDALRSTRCAQLSARSAPDWFKRGFVYQVQPRAFTPEGTLKAATAKLPLVRESGAGIVYLMPVNVLDDETNQLSRICRELGQPKGFYRTKDYFNTDPEFGTNADRKNFVDECHRLGMKVIFDIVLYHCGPSAVLIKKNPNWVERNPDGSVRLGKWGRPVLDFKEQGLREYLYALLGYLVADVGVDGFRCDVAETQPLDFWEEAHRRLSAIKSDVVLICEGYGCPGEQEKAFDCCYDWKGMEALRGALDGRVPLSRIREEWTVKRTHCERGARFLRYVENHDETDASQNKGPRGDSDERWGRKRMEAALFYCFTSDGVPFLYNGNEFADRSFQRMLLKTPIDWSARDTPEGRERLAFVRKFARLRQADAAFSTDAMLTWVDNDCPDAVLSYVKQAQGSAWLCVVNLSKSAQKATVSGYGCHELGVGEWKLISLPVCVKEAQLGMMAYRRPR
ncbi:MAG: hypothetical protein KBT68_05425 [bacterium]|nr:hypothetical protein [Candidatus Colisoma equi]